MSGQVLLEATSLVEFSARIVGYHARIVAHVFYAGRKVGDFEFLSGVVAKRIFLNEFQSSEIGWIFEASGHIFVAGGVDDGLVQKVKYERQEITAGKVYKQIASQIFEGRKPCFFDRISRPLTEFLSLSERVNYLDGLFARAELGAVETSDFVHVLGKVYGENGEMIAIAMGRGRARCASHAIEWKFFDVVSGERLQNSRIFGHKNGNYYSK